MKLRRPSPERRAPGLELLEQNEMERELYFLEAQLEEFVLQKEYHSSDENRLHFLQQAIYEFMESEAVRPLIKDTEVIASWQFSKEERKESGSRTGIVFPGGGLACVANGSLAPELIKAGLVDNIDDIIASSGSSWLAVGLAGALKDRGPNNERAIEKVVDGASIFWEDLSGDDGLVQGDLTSLGRAYWGRPIADLDKVRRITSGEELGRNRHDPQHKKDQNKEIGLEYAAKHSPIDIHIALTDQETHESHFVSLPDQSLSSEDLSRTLMASSEFPVFLGYGQQVDPERENIFWDGDLSMSWTDKARELGVNKLMVHAPKPPRHLVPEYLGIIGKERADLKYQSDFRGAVRYLHNLIEMVKYANEEGVSVYFQTPDPEWLLTSKIPEHRTREHIKGLFDHMREKNRQLIKSVLGEPEAEDQTNITEAA